MRMQLDKSYEHWSMKQNAAMFIVFEWKELVSID